MKVSFDRSQIGFDHGIFPNFAEGAQLLIHRFSVKIVLHRANLLSLNLNERGSRQGEGATGRRAAV